ncbi:dnaJ homolog subfamily B member 14 isoform X2 [Drosophila innubila]|uniref:dnaJ homolog subfamily B member 14 isoform X2 n=1 Tax=Drosophila innubila TaxID=198719 RepID=UPI00148E28D5|nr:dnaJ homolog subfamily B member 14 isoform X2 [Drosophila innubila]
MATAEEQENIESSAAGDDMAQDQGQVQIQKKSLLSGQLRSITNELSLGNYELAMGLINKGLASCQSSESKHDEIMGLLELKNIIVRLRLKCESPDQMIGPTHKSNALPHSFSIEMLDVVQKVLRCRSHYEVLRISHHATYSEVKRAYKRLALRLHPDKNRAPGAEEAFRRINEAADTLTDNQKRIDYNMLTAIGDCFGSKSSLYANYRADEEQMEMEEAEEEDLDMEYSQQRRRSYQPANQRVPQSQSLYQTEQLVIGLVASLVFIIITLHYMATAPNFSFTPTSTHSVRLMSRINHVPYFVTPEFASSQTPKQLQRLEEEIEEIYLTDLKHNCKQERKLRDKLLQRARNGNNRNLRDHALRMPTPACHALVKLDHVKYKPLLLDNNSDSNEPWE